MGFALKTNLQLRPLVDGTKGGLHRGTPSVQSSLTS